MAIDVFLSAGRPASKEQEEYLQAVERFLRQNDLNPRTPGRSHQGNKQPLKVVEQCMRTCKAIVVVAYERLYAPEAKERRGAADELTHRDAMLPTVWNQVEGAIAYTLGLPILILAQKGLRSEALLESKYDWNVQWVEIDPRSLITSDFTSVFNDWRREIDEAERARELAARAASPPAAGGVGSMTPWQLFGHPLFDRAWKVGTALIALLTSTFGVGYSLGQREAPRSAASPPSASAPAQQ